MAPSMQPHESEVAAALDLTNLITVSAKLKVFELDPVISFLARPLKSFGPCSVTQPVADEVSIALTYVNNRS